MQDVWSDADHARIPFAEAWGYQYQGAIYQAIEGNSLPFILAVGTKESDINIMALSIPQPDLDAARCEVEDTAPRYQAIKSGLIAPESCGHCAHCRAVKTLDDIVDYREAGA